jgi:hypothetical protein
MDTNSSVTTMPVVYNLNFKDLRIDSALVEDYIGFTPGSTPEPFPEMIGEILLEAENRINPQGGYVIYNDLFIDNSAKRIEVGDTAFATGPIVTKQLEKASSVAVFACTVGKEVSEWASAVNKKGNPINSYIIDSLGSIAVEQAMDLIQAKLKENMAKKGLLVTNRYSPGYCGWETQEQKNLFGLIPESFCGISLTESMLMKPIKSVSGVVGIGKEVRLRKYSCNFCSDTHCIYRNKR